MSRFTPTEADLDRERGKLLAELAKLQGDDATATAMSLAEESVQPTPGGGKRLGVASEVEAITLGELQAFWEAHLRAGHARLAVVGRFDRAKVRAGIEKAFASLPAGTPAVARDPGDATVKGTLVMGETPTAVAVAVPAPALSDPLYPAFLVLAARLLNAPSKDRAWQVHYDPLERPELLFVTGSVGQAEQPEPAASRIRGEMGTILASPLAPTDLEDAKARFRFLIEPQLLDPAACAADPRAAAVARVRRPKLADAPSPKMIDATTSEQVDQARGLFGPKRTAAVIAGGAIR